MRALRPIGLTAVLAWSAACASANSQAAARLTPSANAPPWVHKSTYVEGRSMFGVGVSAGVRNQGLARDRAANRARNEVSKLVEVYSASLMKDYSASVSADGMSPSEEQSVEQAIKTFTSQLLVGVEVTRFYPDPQQGVLYALAELDLDKQAAIEAARARMGPGLRAWVEQNQDKVLEGLDDDFKGSPPAAPPAADESPAEAQPGAPGNVSPAEPVEPVVGKQVRVCDDRRYLCALGQGSERKMADVAARSELARIFQANINSVAKNFSSAARTISAKTGEDWIETERFSDLSIVSTDKDIRLSRILGRWAENGIHNTLVGIDRAQAARDLRERIESQDSIVQGEVRRAESIDDGVQRLKHARAAIEAFVAREALNSDLRVIRADGRGIPAPIGMSDLLGLLQSANEQLRFGVSLVGQGADSIQGCLEEALTDRGYEVESRLNEQAGEIKVGGPFDVVIDGKLRAEKRGKMGGSSVVQLRLTLRLINGKTGKTLKTVNSRRKATRGSVESAVSTAALQICRKEIPGIVRDIDRYFVR